VLVGRCEGGEPPLIINSREFPPVESREPTRGGNKGGMIGEVAASE
jgi:hypothetical protein